jgi:hypothetical protein
MKLKFIKPEDLSGNLKATIQRTGKLGFSSDAAKKLQLSSNKSVMMAINEDEEDDNLYMLLLDDAGGDYKVAKAGEYYYINLKYLFDDLGIKYGEDQNTTYTIKEGDFDVNAWI